MTARKRTTAGLSALTLCALNACQPDLSVGEWTCAQDGSASVIPEATAPVDVGWSTGFENRFCDYSELAGFCYSDPDASAQLVTSEAHNGRYAVAFTVNTDTSDGLQTRCVRQGVLPKDAYYGAWYKLVTPTTTTGNWNLFHFRGGADLANTDGFLDVSLVDAKPGLRLATFGKNHVAIGSSATAPPVLIGNWFQVQVRVKRGAGTTGEVTLYQDGEQIFDATNLTLDDSSFGQWFVGNLANALTPSTSTLYVDDVTISSSL